MRSVGGAEGSWYRGSQQRHEGHIEASGVSKDVLFTAADSGVNKDIDAAYKEKYGYPSSAVEHITSSQARASTMRFVPAKEPTQP